MAENDEKFYDITLDFTIGAHTNGYCIKAASPEEAVAKTRQCIDEHGDFDLEKFEELGGDLTNASWDTDSGSEGDYEVSEINVTLSENQNG